MAAGPQRLPEPAAHVTAHVAPVERALLARADAIEAGLADLDQITAQSGIRGIRNAVAAEFRALAKELHHWP